MSISEGGKVAEPTKAERELQLDQTLKQAQDMEQLASQVRGKVRWACGKITGEDQPSEIAKDSPQRAGLIGGIEDCLDAIRRDLESIGAEIERL